MLDRPWRSGKFQISAGLRPLGDKKIFTPAEDESRYIQNKMAARSESLLKHYPLPVGLSAEEIFLTANVLKELIGKDRPELILSVLHDARDPVDEIVSQIPEDFSVWKKDGDNEWLALIHLSSPNHWDAREKIGKNFFSSHKAVPHIDPISKAAPKLFEQIQNRGPMERFAWGVATDNRLNHHPEPPPGISLSEWQGRSFDSLNPKLFVRLERQTLFPLNHQLVGFTIRTSFIDVSTLPAEDVSSIALCISGMDEMILKYKGLIQDKDSILAWLNSQASLLHLPHRQEVCDEKNNFISWISSTES